MTIGSLGLPAQIGSAAVAQPQRGRSRSSNRSGAASRQKAEAEETSGSRRLLRLSDYTDLAHPVDRASAVAAASLCNAVAEPQAVPGCPVSAVSRVVLNRHYRFKAVHRADFAVLVNAASLSAGSPAQFETPVLTGIVEANEHPLGRRDQQFR